MTRSLVVGAALTAVAIVSCQSRHTQHIPAPTPTTPTVAVSPATVQVFAGKTQQFSSILTGVTNSAVTWSVTEGSAGGTISATGTYTAPANPGLFHIVATSVADASLVATGVANVVAAPAPVSFTISPSTITLNPGAVQQFSVTATGAATNAVWWSLNEPNAGVINSNGVYTAPMIPGTYHVVATSVLGSAAPVMVAVTVAGADGITVQASPAVALLAPGATQQFSATVTGASDETVVWSVLETGGGTISSDGLYTPPPSSGTYHVVATSKSDSASFAQIPVSVTAPAGLSVTGNVAYSGSARGRIYVVLQGGQTQPGTSIASPGSFNVRGVSNGTVTVFAFMDTVGTGTYLPTADPSGTQQVAVNNTSPSVTITLLDPAPAAPPAPTSVSVHPSTDSVALTWNMATDSQGNEKADHFRLHWGEASDGKCPASLASTSTIPDTQSQFLTMIIGSDLGFVSGLVPGSSYCFAVAAVAGSHESALSNIVGPVAVRAPLTGSTMTGTVSAPPSPASGALYVVFADVANKGTLFYDRIPSPATSQTFTVTGLPNGKYLWPTFVDLDGNGHPDVTDPSNFSFSSAPAAPTALTVSGDLAGQDVGLQSAVALSIAGTSYSPNGNYGTPTPGVPVTFVHSVVPVVAANLKLPVAATLLGGPGVSQPLDMGVSIQSGKAGFFGGAGGVLTADAPTVGQTYVVQVTYQDGTTEIVTPSVTGSLSDIAQIVEPVGTIVNASPVFVWSPPGALAPGYTYCVEISPWMGGPIWSQGGIVGSTIQFNDNNLATSSILNGGMYTWGVGIVDPYGNLALNYGMPLTVQE